MSQLLQAFSEFVGDEDLVAVVDATTAPDGFASGIPAEGGSAAIDTVSAITHHHMGLPFTANGRIAVEVDAVVDSYGSGAAPISATGRLIVTQAAGTLSYLAVPFSDGRVLI